MYEMGIPQRFARLGLLQDLLSYENTVFPANGLRKYTGGCQHTALLLDHKLAPQLKGSFAEHILLPFMVRDGC